jgi:hypothetical protein
VEFTHYPLMWHSRSIRAVDILHLPASIHRRASRFTLILVIFLAPILLAGQDLQGPGPDATASAPAPAQPGATDAEKHKLRAAEELREQEHQRILGVMPNFNTSNVQDAEPLSPGQKFQLAAKSAFDPFTFVAAGFDAALSQARNDFAQYGQGMQGYGKRFGASYVDSFDGTMLGNALFPVLLKQDPRYFRKGTGSVSSRLWYAVMSTVRCRDDNGKRAFNYSNVLGNIAAGGISNLYYPGDDRGVGLTFERAATVTAEGAIGAVFIEFWPDISRRLFAKKHGAALP